jgi:hypothetical protein
MMRNNPSPSSCAYADKQARHHRVNQGIPRNQAKPFLNLFSSISPTPAFHLRITMQIRFPRSKNNQRKIQKHEKQWEQPKRKAKAVSMLK